MNAEEAVRLPIPLEETELVPMENINPFDISVAREYRIGIVAQDRFKAYLRACQAFDMVAFSLAPLPTVEEGDENAEGQLRLLFGPLRQTAQQLATLKISMGELMRFDAFIEKNIAYEDIPTLEEFITPFIKDEEGNVRPDALQAWRSQPPRQQADIISSHLIEQVDKQIQVLGVDMPESGLPGGVVLSSQFDRHFFHTLVSTLNHDYGTSLNPFDAYPFLAEEGDIPVFKVPEYVNPVIRAFQEYCLNNREILIAHVEPIGVNTVTSILHKELSQVKTDVGKAEFTAYWEAIKAMRPDIDLDFDKLDVVIDDFMPTLPDAALIRLSAPLAHKLGRNLRTNIIKQIIRRAINKDLQQRMYDPIRVGVDVHLAEDGQRARIVAYDDVVGFDDKFKAFKKGGAAYGNSELAAVSTGEFTYSFSQVARELDGFFKPMTGERNGKKTAEPTLELPLYEAVIVASASAAAPSQRTN